MRRQDKIIRKLRRDFFLKPGGENIDTLVNFVDLAVKTLVTNQGKGPLYPFYSKPRSISEVAAGANIPSFCSANQKIIIKNLFKGVQGSVKSNNPFMVKNIIPTPALIYLAANLAVSIYMPNAVTGEDSAETLNWEVSCAAAIAKLAGLDTKKVAGVFTFGGTGTNMYALKIALSKVQPSHGHEGIKDNVVVVGSRASHYSHQTVLNWIGIGQNSYIQVGTNLDQTTKLDELEEACRNALDSGKKIACIEAVGGTTSNMAIDDIEKIYYIREELVSRYNLNYRPHIHVDSVLGWAYLNFIKYDFFNNPLGFNESIRRKIKKIVDRISKLKFADSFGVDFHKTGYIPYISSMIIVKDQEDFALLRRDNKIMTPLFHNDSAYNPGIFTLETSRSASNILATWVTLQALGMEGYQVLLGHTLEMSEFMRNEIIKNEKFGLYVANIYSFGCDIFVRCYPPGLNPREQYKIELKDDSVLKIHTNYTDSFAKWLFSNKSLGDEGIALSKTSAAFYTYTGSPVVALRIYPLNPYITFESAYILIERLVMAKREFDQKANQVNL